MMCELLWKSGRENSSKEDLSLRLRGNSKANPPWVGIPLSPRECKHPTEALQGCADAENYSRTAGQTLWRTQPPADTEDSRSHVGWFPFHRVCSRATG